MILLGDDRNLQRCGLTEGSMSKGYECLVHFLCLLVDTKCEVSSTTHFDSHVLIALQKILISVQLRTLPHYPVSAYSCNSIFLSDLSEPGSEALVISGAPVDIFTDLSPKNPIATYTNHIQLPHPESGSLSLLPNVS